MGGRVAERGREGPDDLMERTASELGKVDEFVSFSSGDKPNDRNYIVFAR
jgi:hypothetical protein